MISDIDEIISIIDCYSDYLVKQKELERQIDIIDSEIELNKDKNKLIDKSIKLQELQYVKDIIVLLHSKYNSMINYINIDSLITLKDGINNRLNILSDSLEKSKNIKKYSLVYVNNNNELDNNMKSYIDRKMDTIYLKINSYCKVLEEINNVFEEKNTSSNEIYRPFNRLLNK